jgi:hypothetical protein
MHDVLYVTLAIALFVVSAGYVRVCERLTRVQDQASPDDRNGGRS